MKAAKVVRFEEKSFFADNLDAFPDDEDPNPDSEEVHNYYSVYLAEDSDFKRGSSEEEEEDEGAVGKE